MKCFTFFKHGFFVICLALFGLLVLGSCSRDRADDERVVVKDPTQAAAAPPPASSQPARTITGQKTSSGSSASSAPSASPYSQCSSEESKTYEPQYEYYKLLISGGLQKRVKYEYLFFTLVRSIGSSYNILSISVRQSSCVYVRKDVFNTLDIGLRGYRSSEMETFDEYSICQKGECPAGHYVFTLEKKDNLYKTGQLTLFPQEPFGGEGGSKYLTVWDNLGQPQCYKPYTREEVQADDLCLEFEKDSELIQYQ